MRQNGAESLISRIARLARGRREIGRLAELDDNALRDIGLTRTDVAGACLFAVPGSVILPEAGLLWPAAPALRSSSLLLRGGLT